MLDFCSSLLFLNWIGRQLSKRGVTLLVNDLSILGFLFADIGNLLRRFQEQEIEMCTSSKSSPLDHSILNTNSRCLRPLQYHPRHLLQTQMTFRDNRTELGGHHLRCDMIN
jgi:hypothetical protein